MPSLRCSILGALLLIAAGLAGVAAGLHISDRVQTRLDRRAISPDAVPLTAEIDLRKAHTCSDLSPPIKVGGLPASTATIAVRIADLSFPFDHGGGTVAAPADGAIGEGALGSYMGPCPGEKDHVYRFRVNALDADGKIVGLTEVARTCCRSTAP